MRVIDAQQFGRVAVVMGGDSAERAVSLDGGRQVLAALLASGVEAIAVDGIAALIAQIQAGKIDRVFNLLHGRNGEDGVLQGALRALRIPVTGSGVLGSALSMDKGRSKQIWRAIGLATADFRVLGPAQAAFRFGEALGYPLVVKPVSEGSSYGTAIVREASALDKAVAGARKYEDWVLLETYLDGGEFTVGILAGQALPSIRIETKRDFYDYQAKYVDDDTRYLCPAGLSATEEAALGRTAVVAFDALGCSGWGRVDFMSDAAGNLYLMEVNTTPGMTGHSLVPKAATAAGMDFNELVWRILESSMGLPFATPGGTP